ncbi:hypothetical protein BDF22DRAFT_91052 [Syncephalis plumigaleata]|nr:hypothetical protein BDF22DRAFT_91052 [Syncephalis plumigaleata]
MNSLVNMRVANCIISFYLIITITITITIINTAYFANASISFPYNNRTITRPTFDVFESYYSPYNISGIAYNPSFADNTTCTLLRPDKATRFHNPLTADGVPTFNELVIVLDDDYVRDHGCYTVTQVAIEVQAYGGDLTRYHNYPPTKALLYILKGVYHGVEGAPTIVPYISSSVFIPDDQPPIPVALLSEKYFDEFVDAYDEAGEYIPINLKQELGPWNELFLSNGYRACNTVLVAAGAIIFLSGLRTLLLLIFQGKFSLDPRSIIFIVGLASTLLSTIAIPIRLMCLANYTIVRISTILYSATFYWLLLAWCPVISAVEANRKFPFKMGIIVCYAAQMTVLGIRFILDFVPFNEIVSTAFSVITYINAILQLFTCGIFIYNGKWN